MPNWKKVIVSGSNATFNHITASGNVSSSGDFTARSGSLRNLSVGTNIPAASGSLPTSPLTVQANASSGVIDLEVAKFVRDVNTDIKDNNAGYLRFGLLDSSGGGAFEEYESARIQWEAKGNTEEDTSLLSFWTSHDDTLSQQMTIDNLGNIGIGTNTPPEKLTVTGNISASGNIIATQNGTGSFTKILVGGATAFNEGTTQIQANGVIDAGNTGVFRGQRGKFNIITNRLNGQDIIEFTSTNNVNISGPITASGDISASATGSFGILIVDQSITASNISASDKIITSELNSHGDLIIDADGADILLKDGGTEFGRFKRDSSDFVIKSATNDKDIVFRGVDNSATITALTLDMSAGGDAFFNNNISSSKVTVSTNIQVNNMPTGVDNSVVILDSDNVLKTDEVQSAIFGSDALVTLGNLQDSITETDITAPIATAANTAKTQRSTTDAEFFPVLVDSTNASATAESLKTPTAGFTFNPSSKTTSMDIIANVNTTHITASGNISASGKTEVHTRLFEKTTNTDGDYRGDVVYFGGTTSMTPGDIYHYKSDGTWEQANASAVATCDGLLGVALGTASDTNGVLLRGTVTVAAIEGSEAVGDVLFASTVAGHAASSAPSSNNNVVRVIGYCLDASNGQIWFNPDGTFVEVTA